MDAAQLGRVSPNGHKLHYSNLQQSFVQLDFLFPRVLLLVIDKMFVNQNMFFGWCQICNNDLHILWNPHTHRPLKVSMEEKKHTIRTSATCCSTKLEPAHSAWGLLVEVTTGSNRTSGNVSTWRRRPRRRIIVELPKRSHGGSWLFHKGCSQPGKTKNC